MSLPKALYDSEWHEWQIFDPEPRRSHVEKRRVRYHEPGSRAS